MNELSREKLIKLRRIFEARLDLSDLMRACFDMGIDYENLSGTTKNDKAVSLLLYCEKRNLVQNLVAAMAEMRRDIDWRDFEAGVYEEALIEDEVDYEAKIQKLLTHRHWLLVQIIREEQRLAEARKQFSDLISEAQESYNNRSTEITPKVSDGVENIGYTIAMLLYSQTEKFKDNNERIKQYETNVVSWRVLIQRIDEALLFWEKQQNDDFSE